MIIRLCRTYHKLPSEVLAESTELLRLERLAALLNEEEV